MCVFVCVFACVCTGLNVDEKLAGDEGDADVVGCVCVCVCLYVCVCVLA